MKLELHIIQNFAPSCLNRDDTNTPKDCEFGGFRRARISSQCLKRAIRTNPAFVNALQRNLGVRTRLLGRELRSRLLQSGINAREIDPVLKALLEHMGGMDGEKTRVLYYLGRDEIDQISRELLRRWDTVVSTVAAMSEKGTRASGKPVTALVKEIFKDCPSGTRAADIALFGRMVAEAPMFSVDASCQVAHAISTNRVNMELDFYTAVDDLLPETESGAGMVGIVEFNSSCFYRYSLLDVDQLLGNLGNDVDLGLRTIEGFLRASIEAIPSGKQNSMAAQNLPSFIMVAVREQGPPQSLANAFVDPVVPVLREYGDLVSQSIIRLDEYWGELTRMYGNAGIKLQRVCFMQDVPLVNLRHVTVDTAENLLEIVRRVVG